MNLYTLSSITRTVGATTQLQFAMQLSTYFFATGDKIVFGVQSPGSFTQSLGDITKCSVITPSTLSITGCDIYANQVQITISVTTSSLRNLQINVSGFQNPYSTTTINGNTAQLSTSAGVLKESQSSGRLSNLLPDTMTTAALTPSSTVIGNSGTTLTVNFTPKNQLKTTGTIVVIFPLRCCSSVHMLEVTNPTCTGTTILNTNLNCVYSYVSQQLTITNILGSDQNGGTPMAFTMTNFINPDSAYPKTGFSITTYDSTGGKIDTYDMTLTVTDWGTLSFPTVTHDVTTVNTNSVVTFKFTNPYSVAVGCRLRIDFPTDMPLTAALSSVSGSGYFGSGTSLTFTANTASNYVEIDGCTYISDPNNDITITMQYITNIGWVKDTGNFYLSLYQMVGSVYYKIAKTTDNINFYDFQFTTGLITSFILTAEDTNIIQSSTRYRIKLKPEHNIPQSSLIEITFPSTISLTSGSCTLASTAGGMSSSPSSCNIASNKISIQNPFGSSGFYTSTNTLEFVLSPQGINPQVVQDSGSFTISTYATISGSNYPIDTDIKTNVYTPAAFILTALVQSVSSYETYYSPAKYTLSITPNKVIPQNGKINVYFPSEIALSNAGITSCQITKAGTTSSLSSCTITQNSPLHIQINDAFLASSYSSTGTAFQLSFDGLVNPLTTATTGSFTISTTDTSGNAIESINNGVTTKMTSVNAFLDFQISPQSMVNGAITQYKVTVTSKSPISNSNYLQITFPSEVTLPSSLSCSTSTNVISISCSKIGSSQIQATFSSLTGGSVGNGQSIEFFLNNIKNPPSTQTTSQFTSINAFDSSGNNINTYPNVAISTTTPATVTSSSLTQASYLMSTPNDYTVTYTPINNMVAGSSFLFTYPSSITVPSSLTTCYVNYNSQIYPMTCSVDSSVSSIRVSSPIGQGVTVPVASGNPVRIIFGPITNMAYQQPSPGTFTMTQYTDNTYSYTVDTIQSGLIPSLDCNYPCATCPAASKSSCLSCYTTLSTVPEKYLYNSQCLTNCPAKTYFDTNLICYACDTRCATCANNYQCLTCDPTGTYPLFYNNYCYSACPTGSYLSGGQCIVCSANCLTCSGSSTTCLTCDPLGANPILSASQSCVSMCSPGYVLVGGQCLACNSPCSTCGINQNTCTSCVSGYLYGTTCVPTCPTGTFLDTTTLKCTNCPSTCLTCSSSTQCLTCSSSSSTPYLYNGACINACPTGTFISSGQCISCSPNCLTCSGSSTNCVSCPSSTPILSTTNSCVASCPAGTINISGRCQSCTSPCSSCVVTQTTCTSCIGSYYLYGNQCVQNCPTGSFLDLTTQSCQLCNTKCKTCNTAGTCLTCNSAGTYPYLYNNFCYDACPTTTYLSNGQCIACNTNCQTCSTSPNNCLTCDTAGTNKILSQSNTCVASCDPGYITINGKCVKCNSPCSTCIVDQNTCKTCSTGYLYGTTCVVACPIGYVQSGSSCIGCDPNCAQCSTLDTTRCINCMSQYYLYSNTCYRGCPSGFQPDTTKTQCVVIPPPVKNDTNTTVDPPPVKNDTNQNETISNATNSTESPYVYFPVTTTQVILSGVAAGSYFKDKSSLVLSGMVSLYGPLETIAYGAQGVLSYYKEVYKEAVSSDNNITNTTGRILQNKLTNSTNKKPTDNQNNEQLPMVFYGTLFALGIKVFQNLLWLIVHHFIIKPDQGFQEHYKERKCHHNALWIFSSFLSFKLARFHYSRFFGFDRFYVPFTNPHRIHTIINVFTIINIVLTLLPIIFIDIYGIIKYEWGSQFYIIIIETLILTLIILILSIIEFRASKILTPQPYDKVTDMNSFLEENFMKRLDEQLKLRLGHGLDVYVSQLKKSQPVDEVMGALPDQDPDNANHEDLEQNLPYSQVKRRRHSMIDLGNWDREIDERRMVTDPLDTKNKQKYESRTNIIQKLSPQKRQSSLKAAKRQGSNVTSQEGKRQLADLRKDEKKYGKMHDSDEDDKITPGQRKKIREGKMRGRRDKFYEAVDDEDQSFANETERRLLDDNDTSRQINEDSFRQPMPQIDEGQETDEDHRGDQTLLQDQSAIKGQEKDDEEKNLANQRKSVKFQDDLVFSGMDENNNNNEDPDQIKPENKDQKVDEDDQNDKIQDKSKNAIENDGNDILDNIKIDQDDEMQQKPAMDGETANHLESQILDDENYNVFQKNLIEGNQQEDGQDLFEVEEAKGDQALQQSQKEIEDNILQGSPNNRLGTSNEKKSALDLENELQNLDVREDPDFEQEDLHDKEKNDSQIKENDLDQSPNDATPQNLLQKNDGDLNFDRTALENDILKQNGNIDGIKPLFKTTMDMENEIAKELLQKQLEEKNKKEEDSRNKENNNKKRSSLEMGELDSDDDEEQRLRNMRDPEKRRFNVHDILGDLDRDDKGNLIIPNMSKKGEIFDKNGNRINEKGYLIDGNTGDILENQKKKKIFDSQELDERGEIPPPFNLERYNFNPHDIRGYFDRDQDGKEIIGKKKNDRGQTIDKLGRLVNEYGYLIDSKGNLVDKRGRVRLHQKLFQQYNQGNLPLLFNYKGKKFDIRDVIGELDKDRNGNIIIRRDKDNNMVDKKGKRVNNKGYLLDDQGNVINQEGKVIFENFTLSKDGEIPKLFPFLKFNLADIQGDFELDPLGNPMLQKDGYGNFIDSKGRKVNQKGYLLDPQGNIINKRGFKVFSRLLLEDDGDIPKVFRTGLLKKGTHDSFSQLMSEIEDLEKMQEQDRRLVPQPNIQKSPGREEEDERINKKIEQIMEEDNDDDDMLMKELEELAAMRDDPQSEGEGGNTSVDSMMEDTPSNYNAANQRFNEQEQMRQRVREARDDSRRQQMVVPEDFEQESEYDYMPGRKMKKKKKKKRKQKKIAREDGVNYRELMMAAAYGGLTQAQIDKYNQQQLQKEREAQMSRLRGQAPPAPTTNMRINSQMSNRPSNIFVNYPGNLSQLYAPLQGLNGVPGSMQSAINNNNSQQPLTSMGNQEQQRRSFLPPEGELMNDSKYDIQSIGAGVDGGNIRDVLQNYQYQPNGQGQDRKMPPKMAKPNLRQKTGQTTGGKLKKNNYNQGNLSGKNIDNPSSNSGLINADLSTGFQPQNIRKNNLMGMTGQSFNDQPILGGINEMTPQHRHISMGMNGPGQDLGPDRERRLSNIANSVTGFYRENSNNSAGSKVRSTHESNIAQSIRVGGGYKRVTNDGQDLDRQLNNNPGSARRITSLNRNAPQQNDPDLDRIYGTGRGLADLEMMSDWEKDSATSKRTAMSQFLGIGNNKRVKHLESIYLQRLEPAAKQKKKEEKKKLPPFRIMHHRFHDEAEWYVEENKGELETVKSQRDLKKILERKFVEEFHSKQESARKNKQGEDENGQNIFHGNFRQYLQNKIEAEKSIIDIGK